MFQRLGTGLDSGFDLFLLDSHELLLAAALGQSLEVAADRGSHLVEVALIAHGR